MRKGTLDNYDKEKQRKVHFIAINWMVNKNENRAACGFCLLLVICCLLLEIELLLN